MNAATEHLLACAERGDTPRAILRSIGIQWTRTRQPNWHDAHAGLKAMARRLNEHRPESRAEE